MNEPSKSSELTSDKFKVATRAIEKLKVAIRALEAIRDSGIGSGNMRRIATIALDKIEQLGS